MSGAPSSTGSKASAVSAVGVRPAPAAPARPASLGARAVGALLDFVVVLLLGIPLAVVGEFLLRVLACPARRPGTERPSCEGSEEGLRGRFVLRFGALRARFSEPITKSCRRSGRAGSRWPAGGGWQVFRRYRLRQVGEFLLPVKLRHVASWGLLPPAFRATGVPGPCARLRAVRFGWRASTRCPTRTTPTRCGRGRPRPPSARPFARPRSPPSPSTSASSRPSPTASTETTATTARRCTDVDWCGGASRRQTRVQRYCATAPRSAVAPDE